MQNSAQKKHHSEQYRIIKRPKTSKNSETKLFHTKIKTKQGQKNYVNAKCEQSQKGTKEIKKRSKFNNKVEKM